MTASIQPSAVRDGAKSARGAMIVLATIAVAIALWVGREVFVPFALALVAATVLRPLVRRLEHLRVPASAASALVVIVVLGMFFGIGAALEPPVRELATQLPKSVGVARAKVNELAARVRHVTGSTAKAPAPGTGRDSANARSGGNATAALPDTPSGLRSAFTVTTSLLFEIVEEVLLVAFLLAAGDSWMRKLARIEHARARDPIWPSIAGEMHDVVARYLLVTLLINVVQGVVIGLVLWALGTPTPFLWGVLTFIAEFVPYLGGMVMIGLLLAAGLAVNQGIAHALLAPGTYLIVTTLQNNLVSPVAYGRGLRLNPTMILLAVMFWWMVWGVAGAFLAVPILASLRVLGTRVPSLAPLGVLLEE